MTTIAYRDGVLAGDRQITYGSSAHAAPVVKVFVRSGHLCGLWGNLAQACHLLRWFDSDQTEPQPVVDCAGLLTVSRLEPGKSLARVYEDGGWFEFDEVPFLAFGSGAAAALGAMHMGAAAAKAVEIAALVDPATGRDMDLVTFDDLYGR